MIFPDGSHTGGVIFMKGFNGGKTTGLLFLSVLNEGRNSFTLSHVEYTVCVTMTDRCMS